ncbi:MAG: hypothetical protein C0507_12045 [Cyanobacteria bacterium PR.3.49]|nr:hypothetical protein [Cyanobacteria bacterium PR.3.49]
MKFSLKKALAGSIAAISVALVYSNNANAFGSDESGNIHEQVTREALKGTICDANLNIVVKGSSAADVAGAESAKDPRRHFKTGELVKCLGLVDREKRKVINYAQNADTDEKARARALYLLGQAMHTLQDFYSRSNYIELKEQKFKDDPYNIPLADWTELLDTESKVGTGLKFEGFDKSAPTSEEGKKTFGGATYHKIARELALRETQRQWNLIETLIRNKAEKRGNDVITAITHSACSAKAANDVVNGEKGDLVPDL